MFHNSADKSALLIRPDRTLQSLVDESHELKNGLASQFTGKIGVHKLVVPADWLPELTTTDTETEQRRALSELWISCCQLEDLSSGDKPEAGPQSFTDQCELQAMESSPWAREQPHPYPIGELLESSSVIDTEQGTAQVKPRHSPISQYPDMSELSPWHRMVSKIRPPKSMA